ncbi:interferon-stimulated 20 kDa exonuclease-like 2 [Rhineura floridana]|uniref:interferon-stimulated 20 kDa exonuclease-like 2 n=1 Tax=Rhineura floridana TaxID=261503 RepID=UPI002AC816DC|nr:interferon-stimulated 20 kDa exonuclease-like 2 [Rhineura floridana]XP_061462903.1 interferon-stimulated 20 kDa exonuclease-like 2 [Rhineura floridana]XP_061462904.1 interferon-stimulated 20 kDa exonuclease-like 2 [Rhineura floridana]XP_061462905.1 interferon-stimulated 20 kDa exonuclease-like 2 [Rhineura floridana]XP_061462906.1 interferon-stimulated 20 kDa exonuclease-like 2 [Rhineura floridana]
MVTVSGGAMSDLLLNLDTALPPRAKKGSEGNPKHQRFLKRRQFLERKGFLKQKQLPGQQPLPKRDASHKRAGVDREMNKKRQKLDVGDSVAHRPKPLPKEKSSRDAKDSRSQSNSPSGAPAASSKAGNCGGGGSVRHNGTQANRSVGEVRRVALLSERESGLPPPPPPGKPSKMVAIDCEMVGTGPGGRNSDLARCSVVSYYGDVMYDKYIRPLNPITNYRTRWSGIRRHHMKNAVPFKVAQKEILKILSGKIVIGHAIHNDFKALKYFHPKSLTRDTSKIPLLNRKAGFPENEPASLKRLTRQLLHRDIQVGQNGHSSVEDAQATMELYKVIEREWERQLAASPAQD